MGKIRVKNFGPIGDGLEQDGYLAIDKATLFIGNQATGKSSVAKLFSTLTWLEKSLFTEELKAGEITSDNRFVNQYCAYQGIQNYFKKDTNIDFWGQYCRFRFLDGKLKLDEQYIASASNSQDGITVESGKNKHNYYYLKPKIMYIPAERNFLSVVERPEKIKNLPLPLYTFLDEFERSKSELKSAIDLPINGVRFEYQKSSNTSYVKGEDFLLKLNYASSGIQSLLPLYLVSSNLAQSIHQESSREVKEISLEQQQKLRKEVDQIMSNEKLNDEVRAALLERLNNSYKNQCFINIVEEIEQNLFPTSQRELLYELLKFSNMTDGNKLLLTTHSPYILNYLTLAIKAGQVKNKLQANEKQQDNLNQIIPLDSCVDPKRVNIYEFTNDGIIKKLPTYDQIPSDDNYLNNELVDTNEIFDQLLELEESIL
ncbi:MAG: ATP-binding protein [Bacteroidota bacterium]